MKLKRKLKIPGDKWQWNHNHTKSTGWSKSSSYSKVHSEQAFLKKQEKSQINKLTYHLKQLEKEEQTKPKVSRKKEIMNIKEEINKIEIKK